MSVAAVAALTSLIIMSLTPQLLSNNSLKKSLIPSLVKTSGLLSSALINTSNASLINKNGSVISDSNIIESNLYNINNNINNSVLKYRNLINLNPVTDINKTITVSSYNILSRHYIWDKVYSYLPSQYVNWNNRFDKLNENFLDMTKMSDILCFQEMEYQIYKNYWKTKLSSLGYDSIFQKKPKPLYWKKSSNMMDGVGIFYNKNKFDLINFQKINFANYFKVSKEIDQTVDTKSRLNIRNTVGVIAVLKHKFTKEILFVSNTHLYWSPKHNDVKLMQTLLLTNLIKNSIMRLYNINDEEVKSLLDSPNGPTIIMTGDFNSSPKSMVYKFMSEGFIDKTKESEFQQNYGQKFNGIITNNLGHFKSPYKKLYDEGLCQKTTYTQNFKDIIDYIWFNDSNNPKFKFTKVLGDVDSNYIQNYKGFPNPDFPSDHMPIMAQIEFNS